MTQDYPKPINDLDEETIEASQEKTKESEQEVTPEKRLEDLQKAGAGSPEELEEETQLEEEIDTPLPKL